MQWIAKQTKSKGYEFTFDIMKDDAVIGQAHYIPKLLRQGYGIRLNDSKFLLQYMPAADATTINCEYSLNEEVLSHYDPNFVKGL